MATGYPKPIWDKVTGKIDKSVASYGREHYDLGYIMKRDWSKIGSKLECKIHIYVGETDNYFLDNAVYVVDDFLKTTKDPSYGGEVDYECRSEPRRVGAGTAITLALTQSPDSAIINSTPPRSSNES